MLTRMVATIKLNVHTYCTFSLAVIGSVMVECTNNLWRRRLAPLPLAKFEGPEKKEWILVRQENYICLNWIVQANPHIL